jgi:hypothetical protein
MSLYPAKSQNRKQRSLKESGLQSLETKSKEGSHLDTRDIRFPVRQLELTTVNVLPFAKMLLLLFLSYQSAESRYNIEV